MWDSDTCQDDGRSGVNDKKFVWDFLFLLARDRESPFDPPVLQAGHTSVHSALGSSSVHWSRCQYQAQIDF